MNVFDTLVERGFIATNPDGSPKQVTDLALKEILGKEQVSAYIGFDPTAPSLHIGNLLAIMSLAHLQKAGHRPIVIMGGGTGMIGDPSGKIELRKMLVSDQIQQNLAGQRKLFEKYLDFSAGKAIILNNAEWLLPLNYIEFLRDIGKHFSVNRMLTADCFKTRMEKGLSFLEFNYMVLQAYDFLHLFRNHGCRLQMGGDDQWGNICAGIELIRRVEGKEAYGMTYPLLTNASGAKMGKTVQGAVWLSAELFSPYEYYQFWRNVDDRDVVKLLGLFTFLPMDEVRRLGNLPGEQINEAKDVLAFEATKINHGEQAARDAQQDARKAFREGKGGESVPTYEIAKSKLSQGIAITDLLQEAGVTPSKSEARRLIQKGGAYLNGDRINSIDIVVNLTSLVNDEIMLRSGKKSYFRVIPKG